MYTPFFGSFGYRKWNKLRDMVHAMAAIIQDHIRHAKFVDQTLQEFLIALITDTHKGPRYFMRLAFLIDVDADDLGHRTKEALPHRQ